MSPDRETLIHSFAATYSGDDPWAAVERYRRVMDYAAANPDAGSSAVATATDVPRGTVRGWLDNGVKPDVVRGVEAADEHGWFDLSDRETQRALAIVSAWIYSSGSITAAAYAPQFVISTADERERLTAALDTLTVPYSVTDREPKPAGGGRATQVTIDENASVLGRTLAAYGAPVGEKTGPSVSLPTVLDGAPRAVRLAFAATYVRNRAGTRMEHGAPVRFREERSPAYLDELAMFLGDVTRTETSRSEYNIRLSPAAVDCLLDVSLASAEDVDPMDPRRPDRERALIEELRRVASVVERTPRYGDLETHADQPAGRFRDTFGSLTLAQVAAGLPPTKPSNLPEEYLLAELDAVCEEAGGTVSAAEFEDRSLLPAQTYATVFGSWNDAIRAVGREPLRETRTDKAVTREDVVETIQAVGEELDRTPSRADVLAHSDLSQWLLSNEFDTYTTLLSEAGYEQRDRSSER
jgi:hypothetical protein